MKSLISFLTILNIVYIKSQNYYKTIDTNYTDDKKDHIKGSLNYSISDFNIDDYNINNITNKNFSIIKELSLEVRLECEEILHIKITDKNNTRWEPPFLRDPNYIAKVDSCGGNTTLDDFGFKLGEGIGDFNFTLTHPMTQEVLYSWKDNKFFFSDNLIVFESFLTSSNIYGFGERAHKFKLNDGIYTIWSNDTGNEMDTEDGGHALYGIQPFGLHRTANGTFVGIFFFNINAQDFKIQTVNDTRVSLEHRTLGGVIDLYLFYGDTPEEVVKKYHKIIGKSALPPFWSLGWQQCRFGYRTEDEWTNVINKYDFYRIPLDVMYTDIDYMEDYRDFTISQTRYENLPDYVQTLLHDRDRRYIPIIDIGIPLNTSDPFYQYGKTLNVFIKSNFTKLDLVHEVWPGKTVFPDWFNPNASKFWADGLSALNGLVNFDAIWQDMNEPSGLWDVVGGELDYNYTKDNDAYADIPYITGNHINLVQRQLSINALYYGNDKFNYMTHYNIKGMTSFMQALNTYSYLYKDSKRPFILSRGNVVGLGRYAIHWLGDNDSTYDYMRLSLSGVFNYQMFGFSMMGSDICGFNLNATDKLCARWHVLGSFYTFSRNHNNKDNIPQEPYNLGNYTLTSAKMALALRYSLIRYLYTQLFLVSKNGGTVFKPLFFEFPNDSNLYESQYLDESFMFGKSFIMTPVYTDDESPFTVYYPNASLNHFHRDFNRITQFNSTNPSGYNVTLTGSFDYIHLYLRGGHIVTRQETENPLVLTTNQLRRIGTEIYINLETDFTAEGHVIFDDGYNNDVVTNGDYFHVKMVFCYNQLLFVRLNEIISQYQYNDININKIVIIKAPYLHDDSKRITIKFISEDIIKVWTSLDDDNVIIDLTDLNISFMNIKNIVWDISIEKQ
jgi:lysosomal alpha-glucosidase